VLIGKKQLTSILRYTLISLLSTFWTEHFISSYIALILFAMKLILPSGKPESRILKEERNASLTQVKPMFTVIIAA
jgi:hypothetical protein